MIDAAKAGDECGGDGIGLRTQFRRIRTNPANLPVRRMAGRLPVVFVSFVVVEMQVFAADDKGDVKLRQLDEEPSLTSLRTRNELLAPGEERQMGTLRQIKASLAPPVTL